MSESQRYTGTKICCSICERHFHPGDPVFVIPGEDVVLCYDGNARTDVLLTEDDDRCKSAASGKTMAQPCHFRWMMENPRLTMFVGMIYAGPGGK